MPGGLKEILHPSLGSRSGCKSGSFSSEHPHENHFNQVFFAQEHFIIRVKVQIPDPLKNWILFASLMKYSSKWVPLAAKIQPELGNLGSFISCLCAVQKVLPLYNPSVFMAVLFKTTKTPEVLRWCEAGMEVLQTSDRSCPWTAELRKLLELQ